MEGTKQSNIESNLGILYFQVTDLWKKLCENHSTLFDYTCDEYSHLLASDLDSLEETLIEKESIISDIKHLDTIRQDLISQVNDLFRGDATVKDVSGLIKVMESFERRNNNNHLFRFNKLLIDIIEKIKAQNKKNQFFINKALLSIKKIREDVSGTKNYTTCNSSSVAKKQDSIKKEQ